MTQYLFLFTIGPVQSFIAQARKTQDLYAGSFLLSYLIDSAMEKLSAQLNSCEFIFPHKAIKSKPNRFIATIESDDIAEIGNELKEYVREEFQLITTKVLSNIDLDAPDSLESQVKTHLQVNWVALPLDEDDYAGTYEKLERYLGAIKNVRKFQQLKETGRKCSLCGERNVLFYRGRKRAYTTDHAISLDGQPLKYMHDGEGICAVCFTKRFADKYFKNGYVRNYPSTAEVALMDSLNKLDSGLLDEYRRIFGKNFDTELYYEDNLTERYFEKYNYPVGKREEAKAKLVEIHKIAKEKGLKFCKYYAILMLDGDSMGRWLSGEFLEKKTELKEFHKKLTEELGNYAECVDGEKSEDGIIKEPKGKLVYAGGDDVLAFVNLNHLLPVMKELRTRFPKFKDFGFEIKDNKKSSASAGIAIAHYKTPLSEVLKWARKMEKEAKSIDDDKDAFAIAALKRSGEIRKTVFKWQYGTPSVIEVLEHLIQSLNQEKISNKFIKSLGLEFRRLMDKEGQYKDSDIIKTEMKRWIARSCMLDKGRKKRAVDDLTKKLVMLYTNSKSLDNFLSALEIADFIEREALNDNKN